MKHAHGHLLRGSAAAIGVILALAFVPGQAHAQFQLGLQSGGFGQAPSSASAQIAGAAMHKIDGSVVRIAVDWSSIGPDTAKMPSGFNPSNPGDPGYNWSTVDAAVRAAAALHARVMLYLFRAPKWAEGPNRPPTTGPYAVYPGAWDPSPAAFAQFARAAAVRYSGTYPDPLRSGSDLPRVTDWEIWNEENLPLYLAAPNLVGEYRSLLNAGYGAVKAVNSSNVIIVGGLAPVGFLAISRDPLLFGAELLCLHLVGSQFRADRSCPQRAEFDVFGIHPYSLAATPTKHAYAYDNVLVADMGKVAALVSAADRLHMAAPRIRHQIWVTEWAWFTNPPDKLVGDSDPVAARYVAYAMYEMWRSGVELVIWQNAQDTPDLNPTGGGLYSMDGAPKLMLSAFSFPFIASVARDSGFAWGRVPTTTQRSVRVQRLSGGHWRTVATAVTASDGTFSVRFLARGNGLYRARVVNGPTSLTYDSHPIPPRRTHLFNTG